MFAAKTGMNRIQYQLAKGEISKEKFSMQSKHYQSEIHETRRGLRDAQREMFREAKIKMPVMEAEEMGKKTVTSAKTTPKTKRVTSTKAKKWASKK
jgi:hypothetical protein